MWGSVNTSNLMVSEPGVIIGLFLSGFPLSTLTLKSSLFASFRVGLEQSLK